MTGAMRLEAVPAKVETHNNEIGNHFGFVSFWLHTESQEIEIKIYCWKFLKIKA